MDFIPYEKGSYYVFDRAYNDFRCLSNIDKAGYFFVVRAKSNILYEVVSARENLGQYILKDQQISLTGTKTKNAGEKNLRLVKFYDFDNERIFTYLTNSNKISALRVAELYKNRWLVELFW